MQLCKEVSEEDQIKSDSYPKTFSFHETVSEKMKWDNFNFKNAENEVFISSSFGGIKRNVVYFAHTENNIIIFENTFSIRCTT